MLEVIIVFLYGVIFGSFINAVVWRIHTHRKIAQGRSMCPECKHVLSGWDLIPVVSWIALRGKCRYCKAKISIQYPLVELLTGVLFALSYLALPHGNVQEWVALAFWFYFVVVFMILAVYDVRWLLLPDKVLLPAIVVAAVMQVVLAVLSHNWQPAIGAGLAAVIVGGLFYAIAAFSAGKWLGGGDIKLVFLMGLLLGLANMAFAMLLAFNSAAIVGVSLILTGIKTRKDYIPFGPFLVGGTIAAMLYGDSVVRWYMNLNGI